MFLSLLNLFVIKFDVMFKKFVKCLWLGEVVIWRCYSCRDGLLPGCFGKDVGGGGGRLPVSKFKTKIENFGKHVNLEQNFDQF